MQTLLYREKAITYDGTQLSPHWIYQQFGVLGDAIVGFEGEAHVSLEHMVDLEDVRQKSPIYSPRMLHIVGEWFDESLPRAILLQHLLACELYEMLLERGIKPLRRRGNDIYYQERKLSVSIATKSLTSTLVHLGINIETENTPVPTSGLKEMGLQAMAFGEALLERFSTDYQIWQKARYKVLPRG